MRVPTYYRADLAHPKGKEIHPKTLAELMADGWCPTEKKQPRIGRHVLCLVSVEGYKNPEVFMGYRKMDDGWCLGNEIGTPKATYTVTHWMAIPPMPVVKGA